MAEHPFIANRYTLFFQHVDTHGFSADACWEWLGASKGNGYGHATVNGEQIGAHRVSYELFIGPVPPGLDVCHTCDTRMCVNPDHLFVGTRQQNMADMVHKGRGAGGNRKHLTENYLQEIRQRLAAGHSPRKIATHMNVNYQTITAIKRGASYGGVRQQSDSDRQLSARSRNQNVTERLQGHEHDRGHERVVEGQSDGTAQGEG